MGERKPKKHPRLGNRAIWRVFGFHDVYSYGSRVLNDLCAEFVQQRFASPQGTCTESYAISTRKGVSMTHQCYLSGMCTDSSHAPSHVTHFGLIPIQHESEKYSEKHGFGVIFVSAQRNWN